MSGEGFFLVVCYFVCTRSEADEKHLVKLVCQSQYTMYMYIQFIFLCPQYVAIYFKANILNRVIGVGRSLSFLCSVL